MCQGSCLVKPALGVVCVFAASAIMASALLTAIPNTLAYLGMMVQVGGIVPGQHKHAQLVLSTVERIQTTISHSRNPPLQDALPSQALLGTSSLGDTHSVVLLEALDAKARQHLAHMQNIGGSHQNIQRYGKFVIADLVELYARNAAAENKLRETAIQLISLGATHVAQKGRAHVVAIDLYAYPMSGADRLASVRNLTACVAASKGAVTLGSSTYHAHAAQLVAEHPKTVRTFLFGFKSVCCPQAVHVSLVSLPIALLQSPTSHGTTYGVFSQNVTCVGI